jgi:hypothetical protein
MRRGQSLIHLTRGGGARLWTHEAHDSKQWLLSNADLLT